MILLPLQGRRSGLASLTSEFRGAMTEGELMYRALAELNRQEALVRNGTQWQLQVLEKELDRRRDLQLARLQNSQTAAEEELEYATEHDDHFIRETWRVS